jgi:hypothetical protein
MTAEERTETARQGGGDPVGGDEIVHGSSIFTSQEVPPPPFLSIVYGYR